MIALKVAINNKPACLAGATDLSVLTTILCASGRLGPSSLGSRDRKDNFGLDLTVGGLTSRGSAYRDEFLDWVRTALKPGDTVTIEIVESDVADEPKYRKSQVARRRDLLPMIRKQGHPRRRAAYVRKYHHGIKSIYD